MAARIRCPWRRQQVGGWVIGAGWVVDSKAGFACTCLDSWALLAGGCSEPSINGRLAGAPRVLPPSAPLPYWHRALHCTAGNETVKAPGNLVVSAYVTCPDITKVPAACVLDFGACVSL